MKTTVTILSILVIILLGYIFFKPYEPTEENKVLIDQRDQANLKVKQLQVQYDLTKQVNDKIQARLVIAEGKVKRSEEKLTKSLANEKVYLKRIKEQSLRMSDIQADSAIKYYFREDPDSIDQKVYVDLARLDGCDSVRQSQDSVIHSLHEVLSIYDSTSLIQNEMLSLSRDQISVLQSSSDKADQIIQSKDKEIKKLKRRNKVLKVLAPVAIVLTVVLMI